MSMRTLEYSTGERIITSGDSDKRMYIILEGNVQIKLRDGKDSVIVAELGRSDFFGEMSIFCNTTRSADVIAINNVKLAYIESLQQLNKFLTANPSFAAKMVKVLAERLAKTDDLLIGIVSEVNKLKIQYSK